MQTLTPTETPFVAQTQALCQTLLEQDHFKKLRADIDAFLGDADAQEQYRQLDELHQTLSHRQQTGGALTQEEVDQFNQSRDAMMENPICEGFISARRAFQELQQTVEAYMNLTLDTGKVPTADEVDAEMNPKGGCCGGGCGGGGGGCS